MEPRDPEHHRADIDGLRAVAIAMVVAFHWAASVAPGGFTGVDVFFVISGFLITSILLRGTREGGGWIVAFYERRARRILPALFLMLAMVAALAHVTLLPDDLMRFGDSLVATAAFVSNLFFWPQGGYADPVQVRPLLHGWSLAVEEQFYLVYPLLLWSALRFAPRSLRHLLLAGWAASFALSAWGALEHPVASFYLPVTRAWELATGALLALDREERPGPRVGAGSAWLGCLGLGAIVASAMLLDATDPLPGWLALAPCLGTAALIRAGERDGSPVNRWLSTRALVGLGLISYSLYLWHWPLKVLLEQRLGRDLDRWELAALLVASLLVAALSWRFVEQPFRGRHGALSRRTLFVASAVCIAALCAWGLLVRAADGFPQRLPTAARLLLESGRREVPWYERGCIVPSDPQVLDEPRCRVGARGVEPAFVVWGDSHAERLAIPIGDAAAAVGAAGLVASSYSCPPLLGVEGLLPGCEASNRAVLAQVRAQRLPLAVLSAQWALYAEGTNGWAAAGPLEPIRLTDPNSGERSVAENRRAFARGLERTVLALHDAGVRVAIVGPVPEVAFSVPEELARAEWHRLARPLGPTEEEVAERDAAVRAALADLQRRLPSLVVLDPSRTLCRARCMIEHDGLALYNDDNHLSLAGLALLTEPMRVLPLGPGR